MGVNIDLVISFTFVLGSALAAVAGILFASKYPLGAPAHGADAGLKAFVAAVLGGIGNVPGAMVGGLLLGLAEEFVAGYTISSWRDAVAFGILILILLIGPRASSAGRGGEGLMAIFGGSALRTAGRALRSWLPWVVAIPSSGSSRRGSRSTLTTGSSTSSRTSTTSASRSSSPSR